MDDLSVYLPQDRCLALARGETLPERTSGAALFADISGFTPLTERLTESLGARRGIEELTLRINSVYDALIGEVDRFGGSVITFAGDAITCWFDASADEPSTRAVMCAQAMQAVMHRFPDLSVKVSVTTGPVHRFATGDPEIRLIDALAGAPVARLAMAEHLAKAGEIILDQATATVLEFSARESRTAETGERFFVLDPSFISNDRSSIRNDLAANSQRARVDPGLLKPWILPMVYNIESKGQGLLLTELRPTVALFVRFMGIDYDNDEQARQKLDAVVSEVQRTLERYEGIVLELTIGDKGSYLFASFGASHVHEDDPRRAVRAALEIRQNLGGLVFLNSIQFGLSSGTMRVGAYGSKTRRSFGSLGDDVNLAARLMMTAAPGEILMSQRVRKAIAEEFMVEARLPVAMKGKAEPVPVFAVLGLQEHRAIRLQEPAYVLPMIGRRSEMLVLEEKLELALGGQGQIIGITAEAGMGKSRLVAEGIRLAWRRSMTAFGGTCRSEGINTPYLVWKDIWSAFFDIDSTMPLRKQIRSLKGELQDRTPEQIDALPLFGAVLGLSLSDNDFTRALQPKDRKAQLETVLIQCLQSAAREAGEDGGGLLLVLEDLHWIDPVSFDLLELAARAIERLPVLILVTYRPPDGEPSRRALTRLEALNHFAQLTLTELSAEETEQAIRAKLAHLFPERGGAVPALLIERISSRAQGNPFYVEELLNYLHDRGIDPRNEAALNALDLPASLYSLILSRIDQLAASQQLSLKVASIIGRIFRFADLHNYYPSLGTAEELKADLQELERLDLTPLETPEPDLTYLFKHLVTHEVAYESLAYATRAQLHGEYARYLETTYPERIDQLAQQLAHHFEHAQNQDKARVYLLKAGDQAATSYANEEALAYFSRALELTPGAEPRARFDTLLKRERVFDLLGRRSEQRQDLTELSHLADGFDEAPFLRAQIATRRAQLEIDVGDYALATSSAQAAIREIEGDVHTRTHAADLLVDALLLEARVMFLAGRAVAAKPQLENALALAREHHYVRGEYNALAQLGLWNWYGGDYVAATDLLEHSLRHIRHAGDIRRELEILNNLGVVAKAQWRFSEAIGYYEQAQAIARKIGDRSGEATLLNNMGSASLASGDFVHAGFYSEQAAAMAVAVNEPTLQGMALANRAEAYRELGQYGLAKVTTARALELVRSSGDRRAEAIVLDNMGLIESSLGNYADALEAAKAAMAMAREIGSRPTEASALLHLGAVYTTTEQFDAAEQAIIAANGIVHELGEELTMREVQAALAHLALARGGNDDLDKAHTHLNELVQILLQEPPHEKARFLSLWIYLTCIRVMRACNDPRAAPLIARADAELRARSEKISDAALRIGYLNVPEHRAISIFAGPSESPAN
jgi:predicted ATPase/class 3 adenylate cyclase